MKKKQNSSILRLKKKFFRSVGNGKKRNHFPSRKQSTPIKNLLNNLSQSVTR